MIGLTKSTHHDFTPAERQEILRRLKHGPALPREELAEYASKVRQEVLAKRKVIQ